MSIVEKESGNKAHISSNDPGALRKEKKMGRCTRAWPLEVYYKSRIGGNSLSNAQVLCAKCHAATPTYGKPGEEPSFSEETKEAALNIAKNQCQCVRIGGCH